MRRVELRVWVWLGVGAQSSGQGGGRAVGAADDQRTVDGVGGRASRSERLATGDAAQRRGPPKVVAVVSHEEIEEDDGKAGRTRGTMVWGSRDPCDGIAVPFSLRLYFARRRVIKITYGLIFLPPGHSIFLNTLRHIRPMHLIKAQYTRA